ncbi:MAG: hypothetical protein M1829_000858 [Trizodia sp. TS-e1964]|nr:MAG: hypothetical protein M1829_000858 [Trizodia sp. TS-e1964]
MDSPPSLITRVEGILLPGYLLYLAIKHFLLTMLTALLFTPIKLLTSFAVLRETAFANFWIELIATRPRTTDPTDPLLSLLTQTSGVVLELGPGSGTQIARLANASVTQIYGAEPAAALHPQITSAAVAAGVGDKYHLLACGAEPESLLPALQGAGLLPSSKVPEAKGVFDTIVCCTVLCSVPRQRETLHTLYGLLKPGGRILVWEHVVNPWRTPRGWALARFAQMLYMRVGCWPFFMGGCDLERDTGRVLREIAKSDGGWGSWEEEGFNDHGVLSFLRAVGVKSGGEET